jgi:hypothetical protein
LVLNEVPQFPCLEKQNDQAKHAKSMSEKISIYKNYLQGTIHLNSESMQDIHTAYLDAAGGEVCKRPMIEMFIPQILDQSLNKNNDNNLICSLFVQFAPY